jgi:hypothetical protein
MRFLRGLGIANPLKAIVCGPWLSLACRILCFAAFILLFPLASFSDGRMRAIYDFWLPRSHLEHGLVFSPQYWQALSAGIGNALSTAGNAQAEAEAAC